MTATSLLTVDQVADQLNVSSKSVRRWIESGDLAAVRVGPRLIRIEAATVENFLSAAA